MERSELGASRGGCREHPNNKQQPGVCSSCLTDKLSKICDTKLNKPIYSTLSSPQLISTAALDRRRHRHHASYATDSVSSMSSFNHGLKNSKSVAFASRNRPSREREENAENRKSKLDGFWSKLLKLTTRKTKNDAFMHSKTMRETKA